MNTKGSNRSRGSRSNKSAPSHQSPPSEPLTADDFKLIRGLTQAQIVQLAELQFKRAQRLMQYVCGNQSSAISGLN